jgi:hypothetical protein
MSRSILVSLLLLAGVSASASVLAQNPPSSTNASNTPMTSTSKQVAASPLKPGDRNCLRDTGSLIPPKPGHCLSVPGRSYSQEDIQRTGEPTVGPALQQLDPSITLNGNGH